MVYIHNKRYPELPKILVGDEKLDIYNIPEICFVKIRDKGYTFNKCDVFETVEDLRKYLLVCAVKLKFKVDNHYMVAQCYYGSYIPLSKGDYVVVQTAHHGINIAQVVAVENISGRIDISNDRRVISTIDISNYTTNWKLNKQIDKLGELYGKSI